MSIEEAYYNRRFITNGQRLLENFYAKRNSLEPLDYPSRIEILKKKQKQRQLKWKLSEEYMKLLKENNQLREFIKDYHIKIKGNKINSVLDKLTSKNKAGSIPALFQKLDSKISNIF